MFYHGFEQSCSAFNKVVPIYPNYYCLCVLFYSSFVYTYVCVFLHIQSPLRECRSIWSGTSGLPYYCAPLVCVSEVIELIAVWRHKKLKTKNLFRHGFEQMFCKIWDHSSKTSLLFYFSCTFMVICIYIHVSTILD